MLARCRSPCGHLRAGAGTTANVYHAQQAVGSCSWAFLGVFGRSVFRGSRQEGALSMDSDCARPHRVTTAVLMLVRQILSAAWDGQRLPVLTLWVLFHSIFHIALFVGTWNSQLAVQERSLLQSLSFGLLVGAVFVCVAGYALLIRIYRHSVLTIFNRTLPPTLFECLPSFAIHLALLRPLEIIFRYATARVRVLPDVLVLGEVRCGTTSLCQHLASLDGCVEPFCLWKHPELDRKETFYFVGHYLGSVDPNYYRMCFPLAIVKWYHQRVRRRPFMTFDGCAQYLTNPAVPYLIAKVYRDAGQPPPVLVACVRNPVDQALSWWKFENNSMAWGESMGLSKWNTELRSSAYPPRTIAKALEFSSSDIVRTWYERSEQMLCPNRTKNTARCRLPPWAMTWPGGQLSGIGRNGLFANNIQRYERVFKDVFPGRMHHSGTALVPSTTRLHFVNVVPLDFLRKDETLRATLESLTVQVDARSTPGTPNIRDSLATSGLNRGIHRNASISLLRPSLEPTDADKAALACVFAGSTRELGSMCDHKFGWS